MKKASLVPTLHSHRQALLRLHHSASFFRIPLGVTCACRCCVRRSHTARKLMRSTHLHSPLVSLCSCQRHHLAYACLNGGQSTGSMGWKPCSTAANGHDNQYALSRAASSSLPSWGLSGTTTSTRHERSRAVRSFLMFWVLWGTITSTRHERSRAASSVLLCWSVWRTTTSTSKHSISTCRAVSSFSWFWDCGQPLRVSGTKGAAQSAAF